MQPPERSPRRTALWLTLGVVTLIVLAAGTTAVFLVSRQRDTHPAPGDVALTLRAYGDGGAAPSAAALDRTRQMLLDRMHAAGLTRPTVTRTGTDSLLVTVGPKDGARARSLLAQGKLALRKVLQTTPVQPASGTPTGCPAIPTDRPDLASVKTKLGALYDQAMQIQDPTQVDPKAYGAFSALTCAEVAVLAPQVQFFVPTVSCDQLNGRGPDALGDTADAVVACDDVGTTKYALDTPRVHGGDVAEVVAESDAQQEGRWRVRLRFTHAGQVRWTALTQEAVQNGTGQGESAQVAIVLDEEVVTAPQIQQVITGDAIISGGMDLQEAATLAAQLRYGPLPVTLAVLSVGVVH